MPVQESFYTAGVLPRDQRHVHAVLVSNSRSSVTERDLVRVVASRLKDHPMHQGMTPIGIARVVQEELTRLVTNSILVKRGNVLRVDTNKLSR
ncbi:MAG: hypothetical protein Q8R15_02385 [Candidatus Micrarchaeota archaeon]|nr:hypothetical protein [Candidatus Micrarchaeota archaeon]